MKTQQSKHELQKEFTKMISNVDSYLDTVITKEFSAVILDPPIGLKLDSNSETYNNDDNDEEVLTEDKIAELISVANKLADSYDSLVKKILENNKSFLAYIKKTVMKYVYGLFLTEILQLYDYNCIALQNEERSKIKRSTKQHKKPPKMTRSRSILQYASFEYGYSSVKSPKLTRDEKDSFVKLTQGNFNKSRTKIKSFGNPMVAINQYVSAAYDTRSTTYDAMRRFKTSYFKKYDIATFASTNLALLNLYVDDEGEWLPPSLILYTGFIFRHMQKEGSLFKSCKKYKDRRFRNHDNNNKGEHFDSVINAYSRHCEDIARILAEYRTSSAKAASIYCNEFLFESLMRTTYFSSINSELFKYCTERCDIDSLVRHDTDDNLISDEKKQSLFYYDFLRLLMLFNINVKELQACDGCQDLVYEEIRLSNLFRFVNIDGKAQLPIQYIYNILYRIYSNVGKYLNEMRLPFETMVEKVHAVPVLLEDESIDDSTDDLDENVRTIFIEDSRAHFYNYLLILEYLSEQAQSYGNNKMSTVPFYILDDNQKLIVNHLLDYPSTIGFLGEVQQA